MDRLMSECRVVGRMMCLTFRSGEEVLERISLFGEVAERSRMNHYSDTSYAVALPRFPSPYTWWTGGPSGRPCSLRPCWAPLVRIQRPQQETAGAYTSSVTLRNKG